MTPSRRSGHLISTEPWLGFGGHYKYHPRDELDRSDPLRMKTFNVTMWVRRHFLDGWERRSQQGEDQDVQRRRPPLKLDTSRLPTLVSEMLSRFHAIIGGGMEKAPSGSSLTCSRGSFYPVTSIMILCINMWLIAYQLDTAVSINKRSELLHIVSVTERHIIVDDTTLNRSRFKQLIIQGIVTLVLLENLPCKV